MRELSEREITERLGLTYSERLAVADRRRLRRAVIFWASVIGIAAVSGMVVSALWMQGRLP